MQGWTYDAAGNLTSDGTTTYTFDALNRLTATSATGQNRAYAYNGDGTLVSATANGTATTYAQDLVGGLSQVLAKVSGGATVDYLYGSERLAALTGGVRSWYGTDGQGSARQGLSDAGAVTADQNYDPFGQPEGGSSPSTFGYRGELQDAISSNVYLRARWYQPGNAQLLGVDPALDQTGQPYAYAADDPVNGSDPSGLCTVPDTGVDLPQFGGSGNCDPALISLLERSGSPVAGALDAQNQSTLTTDINQLLVEGDTGGSQAFADYRILNPGQCDPGYGESVCDPSLGQGGENVLHQFEAQLVNPNAVVAPPARGPVKAFLGLCLGAISLAAAHPLLALGIVIIAGVIIIVILRHRRPEPKPKPQPTPQPDTPTPVPPVPPPDPNHDSLLRVQFQAKKTSNNITYATIAESVGNNNPPGVTKAQGLHALNYLYMRLVNNGPLKPGEVMPPQNRQALGIWTSLVQRARTAVSTFPGRYDCTGRGVASLQQIAPYGKRDEFRIDFECLRGYIFAQ